VDLATVGVEGKGGLFHSTVDYSVSGAFPGETPTEVRFGA